MSVCPSGPHPHLTPAQRGPHPQEARRAHRWVPAGPCLLPLPPLAAGRRSLANAPPSRPFPLRDILYNNPSESKRKRRALPGPVPESGPDARAPSPRTPNEMPGRVAPGRGKGPSADSARPSSEKALLWPVPVRKPRASPTASASSNTFHGLSPAREPAAPVAGPRRAVEGAPLGRRKFLGALPRPRHAWPQRAARPSPRAARPAAQPASQHQCQVGQLVTPGRRAVPSRPLCLLGAGGLPRRSGKQRRQKLPPAEPGGEAARVPAHRPYLALERPRSGRAARGSWCASARARVGR